MRLSLSPLYTSLGSLSQCLRARACVPRTQLRHCGTRGTSQGHRATRTQPRHCGKRGTSQGHRATKPRQKERTANSDSRPLPPVELLCPTSPNAHHAPDPSHLQSSRIPQQHCETPQDKPLVHASNWKSGVAPSPDISCLLAALLH